MLFVLGVAYAGKGLLVAWSPGHEKDLRQREAEYALFASGVYPNQHVAKAAGREAPDMFTVYPPYAFPMFGAFFASGSFPVGRVLFQLLTLTSLGFLAWWGARQLAFDGPSATALGAAIPLAFSGNSSVLSVGQFSIICTALLLLQILLLARQRPLAAGLCWAFAMVKPQIALPFALLFLLRRRDWGGLVLGGLLLAGLSALALWWTGTTPENLLQNGILRHRYDFAMQKPYGGGTWGALVAGNGRVMLLVSLAILAALSALVLLRQGRMRIDLPALCATAGFVLFYHGHYDNIMLVFLMIPLVAAALRAHDLRFAAGAALLSFAVFVPPSLSLRLTTAWPLLNWLIFAAPPAALLLLASAVCRAPESSPSSGMGS